MINVNQLRNGVAFESDGQPFIVLKYEFTKMGRGTGNIKAKVRNLETGSVVTKTYTTGNKVQDIKLNKKKMQYLYQDNDNCVFMDPVSFDQVEVKTSLVGEQVKYLVDGMELDVLYWDERALAIELPVKLEYIVKETDPGEKGNSAAKVVKPATLSIGLQVKVPLFVSIGDRVKIDTRTNEYLARGWQAQREYNHEYC